jgi:transposase
VAKEDFYGVLMQADLTVSATVKWKHPQQTRELAAHLIEDLHADRVEVAMEPSGTYGDALYGYLSGLGVAIYRVSPKRVHDAAEVYDGVPSLHDAKSAYIIARRHLDGGSSLWEEIPEQRRERQALIADLDLYQDQQLRNRNRLEALLSHHWPEATRVMELKGVSLLAVLAEYGDPATITAHSEEAWELMRHNGRGLLSGETIGKVLESAPNTLGLACTEGERHLVQVLAKELLRAPADQADRGADRSGGANRHVAHPPGGHHRQDHQPRAGGRPRQSPGLPQPRQLPQSHGLEPQRAQQRQAQRAAEDHQAEKLRRAESLATRKHGLI